MAGVQEAEGEGGQGNVGDRGRPMRPRVPTPLRPVPSDSAVRDARKNNKTAGLRCARKQNTSQRVIAVGHRPTVVG